MDPSLWFGLQAGVGAALFLASAKTHGRQIRLEREFLGFHDVDFRSDRNPPEVESIWRRDRVRFWWRYGALGAALVAYVFLSAALDLPGPPSLEGTGWAGTAGLVAIGLAVWVFPATFLFNTLESAWVVRRQAGMRAGPATPAPDGAWARRAWAGTGSWFLVVVLLAVALAALAAR